MPAHNERFGATAAGRADLKGSAGMPPLRQAAIPLSASGGQRRRGNTVPRIEYSPTMTWKQKLTWTVDKEEIVKELKLKILTNK